jgi:hypothetical protein
MVEGLLIGWERVFERAVWIVVAVSVVVSPVGAEMIDWQS